MMSVAMVSPIWGLVRNRCIEEKPHTMPIVKQKSQTKLKYAQNQNKDNRNLVENAPRTKRPCIYILCMSRERLIVHDIKL